MTQNTILDKIVAQKHLEIEMLSQAQGAELLREKARSVSFQPQFTKALTNLGLSLIAEIKRASPSKGLIRHDFNPEALAEHFLEHGASALSVLTDETFFQGHLDHLVAVSKKVSLPTLRKDFILDPLQIYQAKIAGAHAVLLIKTILSADQMQSLLDVCASIDIEALVEVYSEDDLKSLVGLTGIQMIGINNRDLHTFEVQLERSIELKNSYLAHFPEALWIAESGVSHLADLEAISQANFDAVLIGEGLARDPALLDHFLS